MLALNWKHTSFWYDEALTAYVSLDSWDTLWRWVTQVDIQVPLHYVLLRLWAALVGDSEFALRAFSALCILLAVAGVYAIGKRLAGSRGGGLGLAAAVFAGFLPGVYWIAYEVRAYALALALYTWATAFLLRVLDVRHGARRWWPLAAGYVLLMVAALYTHYTALAGFAAHVAMVAFAALARLRRGKSLRPVLPMALPIALAALLFLPWLPVVVERGAADRSFFPGTVTPVQSLEVMASFRTLARQDVPIAPETTLFVAVYALLALTGLLLGASQRHGRRAALYALLLAAIPLALTVALLVANPKLTGRYFWPAWLGLDVLTGLAVAAITGWRRASALMVAAGLCASPWLFRDQLGAPPDSDYRALFATICTEGTPGDVILLRDGTQFVAEEYYGRRPPCETPRRTFGMPDAAITDVTRWLTLGETQAVMAELAALEPENVWVVSWQGDTMDPQGLSYALLDGLGEHTARLFGDVRLDRYANVDPERLAALASAGPLSDAGWFDLETAPGGPRLIALRLFAPEVAYPGDVIVLQAWWERGEALHPDLRASARLTTQDFGWTYTQIDGPPAGWYFWDDRWPEGAPVHSRYELVVGPDAPPGKIAVRYVIYDAQGRMEPVVIVAGEITVAAR